MPLVKSWVKKRSLRWFFLKNYLDGKGYSVYPTEINCSGKHCPDPEKNLIVDVAAYKRGSYYAFEYKSNGDQLLRAIPQIKNYSVSFDFVIVVAQIPRHDISTDPRRGIRLREITKLGAGFWTVEFHEDPYKSNYGAKTIHELIPPKQQRPHPENKKWIQNKFKRYVWGIPTPEDPYQKTIEGWMA